MANDLKILTGLQVSGSVGLTSTLNVVGTSTLAAVSASALNVSGVSTLTGDVTLGGNIVADANENKSIFAGVTSNTITVGAAGATVSIPGTASVGGNLTVTGDLTVNGTTTTINTENLVVEDKNIILGAVAGTATDVTADGGGITLSGSTDKTFNWVNATDSWTSSEHLDLASGKTLKLATLTVLETGSVDHPVVPSGPHNAVIVSYDGQDKGSYLSIASSSMGNYVSISSSFGTLIRGTGLAGQLGGVTLEGGAGGIEINGYGTEKDDVRIFSSGGGIKLQTNSSDDNHGILLSANNALSGVVAQGVLHVSDNNSYSNFTNVQFDGQYTNITGALKAIDDALGSAASSVSTTNYYKLRRAHTASIIAGSASFTFDATRPSGLEAIGGRANDIGIAGLAYTQTGSATQAVQSAHYFALDVAVRTNGSLVWTNDLVSVQVTASQFNGKWVPKVVIDAPALEDNSLVRMLFVNEDPDYYGLL